jgi:pimeloyl-ACP methyl ester carboxylesterase
MLTVEKGPYKTASKELPSGTMYFPMDAEPPLAGISICPGFLNTGPEMAEWGPFYASWGIVTVVTYTGAADIPDIRATLLLGAIDDLKKENMASGGPVSGKMSGRYGTSGYSMGGGGTTIAASMTASLNSSIGLAAWGGVGQGTKVPTLLLCGDADTVAACDMSSGVYRGIPDTTPKMQVTIPGATHFNWFSPTDTSDQMSGKYALAFQKTYLEGDTRWKSLHMSKASGAQIETNIK